ncbi:deoxyribodipyrimidine photolyase [Sinorhizobium sp. A49]|uniref:cryptochrome/photolyase family protein n=1 Tax=Sinorhizobium sp. A49 TaxID=1945861 RepID=UPI00098494E6|nr:deoxyribodipyrimidine photo-lyase [Sinorhizobium sp. A49]OOG67251.1 deoxyribodipyrimidine photolyase [Sinorhizobium sp. A49]
MRANSSSPILVWFRKDLRLADHHALAAAAAHGAAVIPLYIREPADSGNGPLGDAQRWWLHHSLSAFRESLQRIGSDLVFRSGDPLDVISDISRETGSATIFWNRRYDPNGTATDAPLKKALVDRGFTVNSFAGQLLHEPTRLFNKTGGPYRVFTPFWRALETSGEPPAPIDPPERIVAPECWPASEDLERWNLLPTQPNWASSFTEIWTPGEVGAADRLQKFIEDTLDGYTTARDVPADAGTSLLSPHLAFGEISPAQIWHATRGLRGTPVDDVVTFRKELAWREFSYNLLFHNPDLGRRNLDRRFDGFRWLDNDDHFERWTKGLTGYPIVDAGMRQLWRHGYMHNRVRMIAASFLIKDLLIDWRRGEAWFRDTLVDADPASNAASWQWVAGSGADASPFFRIFNPVLQGEKFDPNGDYVKRFVPELADLDARYIHRPFSAPQPALAAAGITLGVTYPAPIIDHAFARDRALAAFQEIRNAT